MDIKKPTKRPQSAASPRKRSASATKPATKPTSKKSPQSLKSDIDKAIESIDRESPAPLGAPAGRKTTKSGRKPWSKRRKIITWSIVGVLTLLLIVGAFYAYRASQSAGNMLQGSLLDTLQNKPLQKDQFGRTNILVFGTSEDQQGHGGADLADSIMVLSVSDETKQANMMSIPRDLWVDFPNASCSVGREGKINAVYMCSTESTGDKDAASEEFAAKVGEVIGTDVQYFARVNYSVIRDLVDALGGVDVTIQSDDPRGILDRNFDKNCPNGPYTCHYVKYANGPAHLDGEHALALSRARNAKGGYGLGGSNFDREKNQQMILKAVQKKALSTGTLANPNKSLALLDSMGDNISSNLQTSELQSAIKLARGINPDDIVSLNLRKTDQGTAVVTTGSYMGQSIVQPVRGLKDYTDIQAFVVRSFAPPEPSTTSE